MPVLALTRPLELEDLFKVKRVVDPQLAPDGQRVASVVTEVRKKENRTKADISVIAAEGSGGPRQPTASPKRDAHPRWSPDGKWSAFESARDGEGQIFLLPVGGGAARKVTAVATGDPRRMAAAGASYGGYIDKLVSGAHAPIQDARHALRR